MQSRLVDQAEKPNDCCLHERHRSALLGIDKSDIPSGAMMAEKLHERALKYNWDRGLGGLRRILNDAACDRATALLIFCVARPTTTSSLRPTRTFPASTALLEFGADPSTAGDHLIALRDTPTLELALKRLEGPWTRLELSWIGRAATTSDGEGFWEDGVRGLLADAAERGAVVDALNRISNIAISDDNAGLARFALDQGADPESMRAKARTNVLAVLPEESN